MVYICYVCEYVCVYECMHVFVCACVLRGGGERERKKQVVFRFLSAFFSG